MLNMNDNFSGGTLCHSNPLLAIGDGAKTGPATVAAAIYSIDGITYTVAAAATVKPLTAAPVQPVLTKCLYLIQANASLVVSSVKGVPQLTADLVNGSKALQWPTPAADNCPIGYVKITLASTATFTPGTTALDASNVSATYYNVCQVPTKPLLT